MKVVIIENDEKRLNKFIDWALHMVGYAIVLIAVSLLFKNTLIIDAELFGFWGLIAAIIIYVLNQTLKPILVFLTLPITAVTLGLFYPFINVFILNMVDFLMRDKFIIDGLFNSFFVAILISLMNIFMRELIIKPLLEKRR